MKRNQFIESENAKRWLEYRIEPPIFLGFSITEEDLNCPDSNWSRPSAGGRSWWGLSSLSSDIQQRRGCWLDSRRSGNPVRTDRVSGSRTGTRSGCFWAGCWPRPREPTSTACPSKLSRSAPWFRMGWPDHEAGTPEEQADLEQGCSRGPERGQVFKPLRW